MTSKSGCATRPTNLNTIYNVTAHEFGHGLGAHDVLNSKRNNELMYATEQGNNPCRIRQTEWNDMNPVQPKQ